MGARVTRCSVVATGAQRGAYSRVCGASTAKRPAALGYAGAGPASDSRGTVLLRELELAQLDLLQGLLDQPVHVQQGLCPTDIFQVRLGRRVRRREKPAAILVRLDRGLVGADLLRLIGDLHLVHADQRA